MKTRVYDPLDNSHVKTQSPFQLKKRELQGESLDMEGRIKAPNANQGLNQARQTWTRHQRGLKGNSTKAI